MVHPLIEAILAPQLHVAVVKRVGDHAIVADLVPGVPVASKLSLRAQRRGLLVERVVVNGQAERVDAPAPEGAAAVAGGDVGRRQVAGQRRRDRGSGRSCRDGTGQDWDQCQEGDQSQ